MRPKKKFVELGFSDAFLFAAIMEDAETCRQMLERILEFPIKSVHVHTESMILINPEYRGIRMDVHADDLAGTVYDVEMQTTNKGNLPKRSRCYQGQIDVASLQPGDDFNQLNKSYVIFLCTFDPFGRGLYRYTFEERCLEDGEALGDETCKVFLNTKGTHAKAVSPELIQFLHFVGDSHQSPGEDVFLQKLHERIAELKRSRRLEERYMLFGEMLDDERKEGKEEGREEGRNEGRNEGFSSMMALLSAMIADGKESEIGRLSTDPQFVEKMLETYHIEVL